MDGCCSTRGTRAVLCDTSIVWVWMLAPNPALQCAACQEGCGVNDSWVGIPPLPVTCTHCRLVCAPMYVCVYTSCMYAAAAVTAAAAAVAAPASATAPAVLPAVVCCSVFVQPESAAHKCDLQYHPQQQQQPVHICTQHDLPEGALLYCKAAQHSSMHWR